MAHLPTKERLAQDFLKKAANTVKTKRMLAKNDRVVCAVSGGIDSVVMLSFLESIASEYSLKLLVAHLNHNLRGAESRRDARFVKALASKLGLEFYCRVLKKGALGDGSLQEAARAERMKFLTEAAVYFKATKIATGHTLDDNAETVLMRLISGAGLRGLGGIHPRRGPFIRPLIERTRAEIERFARAAKIAHVEDSSNATDKYLRNSVRHKLIPLIVRRYNPNFIETISRTSSILRSDEEFLSDFADKAFKRTVVRRSKSSIVLDRRALKVLPAPVLSRVMMLTVEYLLSRTAAHSKDVISFKELISTRRPNASFDMHGLRMYREYDYIVFETKTNGVGKSCTAPINIPGDTSVKGTDFILRAEVLKGPVRKFTGAPVTAYFDLDAINDGLVVRNANPGDRMEPLGMSGHRKLKDIFIDNKIPISLRKTLPIVCSNSDVLWLSGVRQSELYKVTPGTKKVLKLSLLVRPGTQAAKRAIR